MSDNCNQTCNTCSDDCTDRKEPKDFTEKPHELSNIKRVIGVVSGKGGVGKSLVTSMMAVTMNRKGYKTAILDADITGPSIPKVFSIDQKPGASELGLFPAKSKTGIQLMSINFLLKNETDPVIWRGPILGNTVKQFWSEVIWGDVDYMFIDMPPGTGDVPLTVFQSIKVDGIIIVTSPQELVSMIVAKAVNMAKSMNVPIIGLVENMAYFKCPGCDQVYHIFGESTIEKIAEQHQLPVLARLPIDPQIAALCDKGRIEEYNSTLFDVAAKALEIIGTEANASSEKVKNRIKNGGNVMKIAVASEGKMVTEHFGHCEGFIIFDTEGQRIIKSEIVANPGHRPGFLPNFLNDLGVKVVISGGMGGGAIDIFNEKDIEVIVGATGEAQAAVELYLKGSLKSTGSVCHEHQHHDECGQH